MTIRYLSSSEAAKHIGLSPVAFASYMHKGRTPEPDAMIGTTRGWLPETVEKWQANRPGRGYRTDLHGKPE